MDAELAEPQADEKAEGELDDESDPGLRHQLKPLREKAIEEEDGKPVGEERRRLAKAPGKPERPGATCDAFLPLATSVVTAARLIRVGRMAESEKHGDSENDPDGRAVGGRRDSLVEAEHRVTSCRGERV